MALTVTINGTGVITNAETTTNWNSVTIGSESQEGDFYLQGSYCVSAQASNKAGELYCDVATEFGRNLDFDTSGADEGQLLFMWIGCTTLGILESVANYGLCIRLYSGSTVWSDWTIAGYDDLRNFRGKKGGFVCFALDPTTTPTRTNGGGCDIGAINWVGIHIETTANSKTQNVMIDTIAVGYGIQVTGTDTDGLFDAADYCTAYATRAWGMLQYDESNKIIYSMGKLTIGDTDQIANTVLTDSGKNFQFIRTVYWYSSAWTPMVNDNYLGIDYEDNGSYYTRHTDGIIVGTDSGRNGSTFEGNLDVSCYYDCSNLTNSSSYVLLYNTKFFGIDGYVYFIDNSNVDIFSCVFDNCEEVDMNGYAGQIRNTIFSNTASSNGSLLWYTNMDLSIQDSKFINNGYAIRHTVSEEVDYNDLIFIDNTKDVYFTAASGDLTVNNVGTSNASSFTATGTGTVYFVTPVTFALTDLIANSEVRLIKKSDNSEIDGIENSGTSFQYNYNWTGDIDIWVTVLHIDYEYIRFGATLSSSNQSIPVFQSTDRNFNNP